MLPQVDISLVMGFSVHIDWMLQAWDNIDRDGRTGDKGSPRLVRQDKEEQTMKKLGHLYFWYRMTDHHPRLFKNDYAIGIRIYRFCLSWTWG